VLIQYTDKKGKTSTLGTFNITRDGWFQLGTDKNGDAFLYNRTSDNNTDIKTHITNRHKEQYGKGTPSFTMGPIYAPIPERYNSYYLKDGNPAMKNGKLVPLQKDAIRYNGYSEGAEFHVGGYFLTILGASRLAGTYGCFAVVDPSQISTNINKVQGNNANNVTFSNEEMQRFGDALNAAEEKQAKEFGKSAKTEVEIKKRDQNETKSVPIK
jgi:hypothetical protein